MSVPRPRPVTDVHQHLWPPALVAALRARRSAPRLRGWTLELDGEPAYVVDSADHEPAARAGLAVADGLQRALVSLSSPLGIESLPAPFGAWAAASLTTIDQRALARELDRGFVGLQLPATALLDARGYAHAGPLLELLAERDRPLFIHPGPAVLPSTAAAVPAWWPAVVDYVGQMHAAWFAFRAFGRPAHPRLRVLFAMLAGLAPLHGERFRARAGERTVIDPGAFLETSSYGPRAIDAVLRVTGIDVLVHGSDRPYATPPAAELGEAGESALRTVNPAALLHPTPEEVLP